MDTERHRRRRARNVVTLLCVVALVAPTAGAAADPGHDDLEQVESQLEDARRGLGAVEGRQKLTLADLERVEAERAELDARLGELTATLRGRERALADAEAVLARTTGQRVRTEQRLDDTRRRLDEQRAVFAQRVRASFKHSGAGYLGQLLEVDDAVEFTRSLKYVRAVMATDRQQVALIGGLKRQVSAELEQLAELQERQDAARRVAAAQRDEVATVVAQQKEVRAQVAAKADEHRMVLAQLARDEDGYQQLIASLEAESERIEAELRRRAEEQARRRAAEEARQRAAEAARQRAAEEARRRQVAAAPSREAPPAARPSTSRLQRPSDGPITSRYGWRTHPISGRRQFHAGLDFGAPTGAPIYAAEDGVVAIASTRGGYGNTTVVDHGDGLTTLYAHQSRFKVGYGQQVSRGQVIGYVGSTGYSTGPHLHFEVRVNGSPRDPENYL